MEPQFLPTSCHVHMLWLQILQDMIWYVQQINKEIQQLVAVKWLTVHLIMLMLQYRRFSPNKLPLSQCLLFVRT